MTAMPDPRLQAQPPTGADGAEAAQRPWSVRAWPQRPAGPSALRGEEMWHRETSFLQICCSGCPCASSPQVARQCCGSNLTRCPGQGASGFPACRTDLRGQDRLQGAGQTPGDRTDPCQGHASSRVQSSAGSAAPLGAFHAIAPCPLSTKGHQGQLSCSGSAACFPLQALGTSPEGRSPRLLAAPAAPAVRQLSWDVPLFLGGSWLCGVASSRVPSWCQLKLPLQEQELCAPQSLPWLPAGGAVRGVILKSLWVGKSLDFISPFQCEFFETFHSDITLRFSTASEFLPINGKNINVHLGK